MYECKKTCALRRTFVNDHEVGMSIFIHLADAAEQETHACILIETLTLAWLSISDYVSIMKYSNKYLVTDNPDQLSFGRVYRHVDWSMWSAKKE